MLVNNVAPKITYAWHFRIKTVAGFHRSDIRPFRVDPAWIKKTRSESVGRNKNGLLPYEINPEQPDWIKNEAIDVCGKLVAENQLTYCCTEKQDKKYQRQRRQSSGKMLQQQCQSLAVA